MAGEVIQAVRLILFVYATCVWSANYFSSATRRKYGIPDDDHRPFTVAYAAVKKSQKGKAPDYGHRPMIADVAAAPSIPASLRQRGEYSTPLLPF